MALLALAGGIWFHSAVLAQELAPAANTDSRGVTAEAAEQGTNAPSAAVTNDGAALHYNYWSPASAFGSAAGSHGCVGMTLGASRYLKNV